MTVTHHDHFMCVRYDCLLVNGLLHPAWRQFPFLVEPGDIPSRMCVICLRTGYVRRWDFVVLILWLL